MASVRDENNIPELIDALPEATADAVAETARDAYDAQQSNWDTGRDAMGLPWAPLAPETIRRKGNTDILIDTGEMKDDTEVAVDRGSMAARVGPTTDRSAEILSYHEYGVPSRGMPARPVLAPTGRHMEEHYRDTFTDHIGTAVDSLIL